MKFILSSSFRPAIIVFHCELSSEHAPHLYRLFHSLDRQYNLFNYPNLLFPSIYLLNDSYADI